MVQSGKAGGELNQAVAAIGHAVAGGIAGMAAIALFYPLSTVSTRMQVQMKKSSESVTDKVDPLAPPPVKQYKNTMDAFATIVKEEGPLALYAGLKAALIGIGASNTVYYYWYTLLRSLALKAARSKELGTLGNLSIASAAGVINVCSTIPIWVINTRMQLDSKKSLKENVLQVYAEDGVKGFYKGIVAALILVSNPAVQFMVYERVKSIAIRRKGSNKLTSLEVFILGAIAKMCATLATFPYLLIKSRLQAKGVKNFVPKYAGFVDAVTKILKNEGILGFYKGIESKIVQTVLGAAFMFLVKEKIAHYTLLLLSQKRVKASAH